MTDAIVTDLNEYRDKKGNAFSGWSDNRIVARYRLLENIENGKLDLDTVPGPLLQNTFPEGYDPSSHPEENLAAVKREAIRRGVELN